MQRNTRQTDYVARMGGDEFATDLAKYHQGRRIASPQQGAAKTEPANAAESLACNLQHGFSHIPYAAAVITGKDQAGG